MMKRLESIQLRFAPHDRRGSAIVLAAAILVLLVIIATAYFGRTNTEREITRAQSQGTTSTEVGRVVGDRLAHTIADHLFPHPVVVYDENTPAPEQVHSYWPRHSPLRDAVRYGRDMQLDGQDNLRFPYNVAPYHVVPWTNWPQRGNDDSIHFTLPATEGLFPGEMPGQPGFLDTRWLSSTEPYRAMDMNTGLEWFTHWPHMTYLPSANNGWRLVRDISNVTGVNRPYDGILGNLNIPVEQFLPALPFSMDYTPEFFNLWQDWFGGVNEATPRVFRYERANQMSRIPPNFLRLSELGTPYDEFDPSSPRHQVSRILTDVSGDGFTDSFWFVPTVYDPDTDTYKPQAPNNGIMHIVAARIVDNSALFNASVATRFERNEPVDEFGIGENLYPPFRRTMGHGPSDLAMLGQAVDYPGNDPQDNWNTGLLDNPLNHSPGLSELFGGMDVRLGFNPTTGDPYPFSTRLDPPNADPLSWVHAVGLTNSDQFPTLLGNQIERLSYWQFAGLRPFAPLAGLTPFGPADELALRMYHGNNYAWTQSRFEKSIQKNTMTELGRQILRSNLVRHEASEWRSQLNNPELVLDLRRKITLFSGARNDIMPPWLWNSDANPALKIDLRNPNLNVNDLEDYLKRTLTYQDSVSGVGTFNWSYYGPVVPVDFYPTQWPQPAGPIQIAGDDPVDRTNRMAESFAVNIKAWTGTEWVQTERFIGMTPQPFLVEAFIAHVHTSSEIPQINWEDPPPDGGPQFPGWDSDPDIRQRYVDYYPGSEGDPQAQNPGNPWRGQPWTTVVAVQIANPYSQPINLSNFQIRFMDQTLDLGSYFAANPDLNPILYGATEENPRTAIFYAMVDVFPDAGRPDSDIEFGLKWREFLDIQRDDEGQYPKLAPGTRVFRVPNTTWSTDRRDYDSAESSGSVEILRNGFVIDRFDGVGPGGQTQYEGNASFRTIVTDLPTPPLPFADPENFSNPGPVPDPPPDPKLAGIRLESNQDDWVTWARVTRPWGDDFNYDDDTFQQTVGIQGNERSPRFVFSVQQVTGTPNSLSSLNLPDTVPNSFIHRMHPVGEGGTGGFMDPRWPQGFVQVQGGEVVEEDFHGDVVNRRVTREGQSADPPNLPWIRRLYTARKFADSPLELGRKPVLFTMNPVFDRNQTNPNQPLDLYPDFNDSPYQYGRSFFNVNNRTAQFLPADPRRSGVPDKGFFYIPGNEAIGRKLDALTFPLQMLHKGSDFEHIGELNLVFLWGHEIDVLSGEIAKTFSEYMWEDLVEFVLKPHPNDPQQLELLHDLPRPRVNRLQPTAELSAIRHLEIERLLLAQEGVQLPWMPALPAAVRILDGFVCDAEGRYPGESIFGIEETEVTEIQRELARFRNARAFSGQATPGMVNINTAPVEVLRALPHMYKMVDGRHWFEEDPDEPFPAWRHPRVTVPEAIVQYRNLLPDVAQESPVGTPGAPSYWSRGRHWTFDSNLVFPPLLSGPVSSDPNDPALAMRSEAGFSSIGELQLLRRESFVDDGEVFDPVNHPILHDMWRIDFSGYVKDIGSDGFDLTGNFSRYNHPLREIGEEGAFEQRLVRNTRLSTSLQFAIEPFGADPDQPIREHGRVAGDAGESNLLFSGLSNMVTTRSDVFTVYFKVRSFRQNPETGIWNALDPEHIIDESRYVMVIDRSRVNSPGQKPEIILFERLPN